MQCIGRHSTSRVLVLVFIQAALSALPAFARSGNPVDRERVAAAEDLSESLANQLHNLSLAVRQRDMDQITEHFAADLTASLFPRETSAPVKEMKWVYGRQFSRTHARGDRSAFLSDWEAFLAHFSRIEDVRFKVKQADFGPQGENGQAEADAKVYFFVIGDLEGQAREWVEAKAHINARLGRTGSWQVHHFDFTQFHARFVESELFSEISQVAQVYNAAPPFGTPGNQSFSAHGVALHDVNQDGLLDIFAAGRGENYLYINTGDGTFANRAADAGLQISAPASGPLFIDYDNDGDSDLFLAAVGHQMLFENRLFPDGDIFFWDVSERAGVARSAEGYGAVSAVINGDGYPDIYVASYNRYGKVMPNSWSRATNGTPNLLFVNRGDGTFQEQAVQRGVADGRWSYAAFFADLNEDSRPDLYVANDFGENALFLNEGDSFRDVAPAWAMTDPGNGMGVSLGDYNNDGRLDIHVTNMSSTAGNRILKRLLPDLAPEDEVHLLEKLAAGNTIFANRGNTRFEAVTSDVGPLSAGWAFGGGFADFDNDGWEDLHVPNGFITGKSMKDT